MQDSYQKVKTLAVPHLREVSSDGFAGFVEHFSAYLDRADFILKKRVATKRSWDILLYDDYDFFLIAAYESLIRIVV